MVARGGRRPGRTGMGTERHRERRAQKGKLGKEPSEAQLIFPVREEGAVALPLS